MASTSNPPLSVSFIAHQHDPIELNCFWPLTGLCMIVSAFIVVRHVSNLQNEGPDTLLNKLYQHVTILALIWSLFSFIAVWLPHTAVFCELCMKAYEAYALFCFFEIVAVLIDNPKVRHTLMYNDDNPTFSWSVGFCYVFRAVLPLRKMDQTDIKVAKWMVMQYNFVVVVLAILQFYAHSVRITHSSHVGSTQCIFCCASGLARIRHHVQVHRHQIVHFSFMLASFSSPTCCQIYISSWGFIIWAG